MIEKVALFAGNGALPKNLIEHFVFRGIDSIIIAFEGMTAPKQYEDDAHAKHLFWHKIGHVGVILDTLRAHNVTHIVMAGHMHRPSLTHLSLDWLGTKWMARMGLSAFGGDDALLSKLAELLLEEGFTVVSPHTIISDLTSAPELLTTESPNEMALHDIKRGRAILHTLSPHDVGQAIVIQEGLVLGVEAIEGTAALLERVRHLKRDTGEYGGVLVKLAKHKQSLLVDLPTIGPDTIFQVLDAGLAGLAISAHTTQILDKQKVIDLCDTHQLFLLVIDTQEYSSEEENVVKDDSLERHHD